jgi:4-amino-4-deoxy-L-arabinose transferase-like glycosyltransferase
VKSEIPGVIWQRRAFTLVLVLSTLLRCMHLGTPLLDGMANKQIFVAQRARGIAGPPFNLMYNSFDFLNDGGERLVLTEEIPLYAGLLAAGYRLFGEYEWLGRLLSIGASALAIFALYDLVRREMSRTIALVSAIFFAFCPLLLGYGQTVQPDACMLAGMLVACFCYSRFLERGELRWWLAATSAGALAGLFKYYGLMVLVPLAFMTFRACGLRLAAWLAFGSVAGAIVAPVAAWMLGVFIVSPNPAEHSSYFLFQMPELLGESFLYSRFVDRFLYKDVGPAAIGFVVVGVLAALFRRLDTSVQPILGWTVAGLCFYVLMAPLVRYHDYYELMLLPAASVWAALGWQFLYQRLAGEVAGSHRWRWAVIGLVLVVGILHSPLVIRGAFSWDRGYALAAQRLGELTSPSGRVVVIGGEAAILHYARREGWGPLDAATPAVWHERLARYRQLGAEYAVIYISPGLSPEQQGQFKELAAALGASERHGGRWSSDGRESEYYIVSLKDETDQHAIAR